MIASVGHRQHCFYPAACVHETFPHWALLHVMETITSAIDLLVTFVTNQSTSGWCRLSLAADFGTISHARLPTA